MDDCEPEEKTAREECGMPPEDGSGEGWFNSPELDGMPMGYDPDYERLD